MTYYHKFYIALKPHNLLQNGMFLLSTFVKMSCLTLWVYSPFPVDHSNTVPSDRVPHPELTPEARADNELTISGYTLYLLQSQTTIINKIYI